MSIEKKLEVKIAQNKGSVYEIRYQGGGQTPDSLTGLYTTRANAQRDIDSYVPARPKKVKKDGKTNS